MSFILTTCYVIVKFRLIFFLINQAQLKLKTKHVWPPFFSTRPNWNWQTPWRKSARLQVWIIFENYFTFDYFIKSNASFIKADETLNTLNCLEKNNVDLGVNIADDLEDLKKNLDMYKVNAITIIIQINGIFINVDNSIHQLPRISLSMSLWKLKPCCQGYQVQPGSGVKIAKCLILAQQQSTTKMKVVLWSSHQIILMMARLPSIAIITLTIKISITNHNYNGDAPST